MRYAFVKDDIKELAAVGKVLVVIVEAVEGSTQGTVIDADVCTPDSAQEYMAEMIGKDRQTIYRK